MQPTAQAAVLGVRRLLADLEASHQAQHSHRRSAAHPRHHAYTHGQYADANHHSKAALFKNPTPRLETTKKHYTHEYDSYATTTSSPPESYYCTSPPSYFRNINPKQQRDPYTDLTPTLFSASSYPTQQPQTQYTTQPTRSTTTKTPRKAPTPRQSYQTTSSRAPRRRSTLTTPRGRSMPKSRPTSRSRMSSALSEYSPISHHPHGPPVYEHDLRVSLSLAELASALLAPVTPAAAPFLQREGLGVLSQAPVVACQGGLLQEHVVHDLTHASGTPFEDVQLMAKAQRTAEALRQSRKAWTPMPRKERDSRRSATFSSIPPPTNSISSESDAPSAASSPSTSTPTEHVPRAQAETETKNGDSQKVDKSCKTCAAKDAQKTSISRETEVNGAKKSQQTSPVQISPMGEAALAASGVDNCVLEEAESEDLNPVSGLSESAFNSLGQPSAFDAMNMTRQIRAGVVSEMVRLRAELSQRQADSLFEHRRWWYKPVAIASGKYYSMGESVPVNFVIGKRMVCEQLSQDRAPKLGFLVFDCAARALEHAIERRGRHPLSHIAGLRVRVREPRAPSTSHWPTNNGSWAFRVMTPEAIALEWQTWMAEEREGINWLPNRASGHCRQCALGDKTCVQARNPSRCSIVTKPKVKPSLPKTRPRRQELLEKSESKKIPTALDSRWYV